MEEIPTRDGTGFRYKDHFIDVLVIEPGAVIARVDGSTLPTAAPFDSERNARMAAQKFIDELP